MKLSDKIVKLRKTNGMSQEELAEKLQVSRQAISKWEGGSAMPDASNILQLSKLFGVTCDYLLNDSYESDDDLPKIQQSRSSNLRQHFILLIALEIMALILQFVSFITLQNTFFGLLSFIPFVAVVAGFEFGYQKNAAGSGAASSSPGPAAVLRKRFYIITVWLGAYFPIRMAVWALLGLYPRPMSVLVPKIAAIAVYLLVSGGVTWYLTWKVRKEQKVQNM